MLLFIVAFFTIPTTIWSANIISFKQSPRINWDLSFEYDDNIFLYSQSYLNDFMNQNRAYRFPFRTYDDLITRLNLNLQFPYQINKKLNNLSINYRQYLYLMNTQKSYQLISLNNSYQISKPVSFQIGYLFLPNYLIRYYRNPLGTSTDYIGCIFTEHLISFNLRYRLPKITLSPFFQYEIDDYIKNFNYYDGSALRYGVNTTLRYFNLVDISLKLMRKQLSAQGPIPDISYNENKYSINLIPNFSTSLFNIDIGFEYSQRYFTTENSFAIDPFHAGRSDHKYNLNFRFTYNLSKNFQLFIGYENEQRKVNTPYQVDIEEIKDYNNNKYILGITFNPRNIFEMTQTSNIEIEKE